MLSCLILKFSFRRFFYRIVKSRSVSMRFTFCVFKSFSFFPRLAANDRGYGLGRSAGGFPVAIATKEMRAQRLPEAHQPPKAHRRVLAAGLCQHKINLSLFCLTIREVADCLLIQLSQCFKSVLGFVLLTASRLFL